ncbi:maintenance of telomere capping protein 1 [Armillaria fumosa]|nr:maintenance of telomere capping protein 1 [Armillaria fumosa]
MAKSKSKQEEALQLLDDLDSFTPLPEVSSSGTASPGAPPPTANEGEAEVLAFLDEITQKSSEPTRSTTAHLERPASRSATPTLRKSTERVRLGGSGLSASATSPSPASASKPSTPPVTKPQAQETPSTTGGWGWGSVWTSASAAIQQAKTAVDEQVKQLPKNELAKKWGGDMLEYAKSAQLDKLGQDFKRVGLSTLTDILNAVAPPISEHEIIQVWLSHDMTGYDGVESLVYRSLARIMEQVDGGDLIVNKGNESRPKDGAVEGRELNAVEGYDAAVKLAQANLDEMIKMKDAQKPKSQPSAQTPISYSYVYLRVQPFLTSYPVPSKSESDAPSASSSPAESSTQQHLQFLLYFSDPALNLVHTTITQSVPGAWLGLWDDYEWVEDLVAEALRIGVEVVGQEYVVARMGWAALGGKKEETTKGADKTESKDGTAEESTNNEET